MNYQGSPCFHCGEIIKHYSLSGLCSKCWHEKRGGYSNRGIPKKISGDKEFCEICGRPIKSSTRCVNCKDGLDIEYLNKYRLISRGGKAMPEHRYLYELLKGDIPDRFIVHHLNGLKGDNRKENLFSVKPSHHNGSALILETQKRICELEKRF